VFETGNPTLLKDRYQQGGLRARANHGDTSAWQNDPACVEVVADVTSRGSISPKVRIAPLSALFLIAHRTSASLNTSRVVEPLYVILEGAH
jgi:hypothetical protein